MPFALEPLPLRWQESAPIVTVQHARSDSQVYDVPIQGPDVVDHPKNVRLLVHTVGVNMGRPPYMREQLTLDETLFVGDSSVFNISDPERVSTVIDPASGADGTVPRSAAAMDSFSEGCLA